MIKTSESVLKGHPDKICDGVADYILTELLKQDKDTRAGIECLIKDELLVIAGEVSTKAVVNYKELARNCLEDIGLNSDEFEILEKISVQSSDIALGVDIVVQGIKESCMVMLKVVLKSSCHYQLYYQENLQ